MKQQGNRSPQELQELRLAKLRIQRKIMDIVALAAGVVVVLAILQGIFYPYFLERRIKPIFGYTNPYNLFIYGSIPFALLWMCYANLVNKMNGRKPFEENNAIFAISMGVMPVIGVLGFLLNKQIAEWTGIRLSSSLLVAIVPLVYVVFLALRKANIGMYLDCAIVFLLFVIGMGRMGCHTVGCCYGFEIHSVIFTRTFFPIQIIEFATNLLTAGGLLFYLLKAKRRISGILYPIGMLAHGAVRFFWEMIIVRPDTVFSPLHQRDISVMYLNNSISAWQVMCLTYVVCGGIWLYAMLAVRRRRAVAP